MSSHDRPKQEWLVLLIAGAILVFSVLVNTFNETVDVTPAYYLFATVASLVFGATVINKFK